jgi:uncharacterized membrane protein
MLQDMNNTWMVDLSDAVAVYRDQAGKLRVDQSYQMTTGKGAGWSGLFGGLIGALLAAPFTGGESAAVAAGALAAGSLSGVALGATLGGGTVLRTTLSKEQQAKVEATLQGR